MRLLSKIRKLINPPYSARDLLIILGTLVILVAIPLTSLSFPSLENPTITTKAATQTITLTVSAGADDAYQSFDTRGSVVYNQLYIIMNSYSINQLRYGGGFRFTGVNVPKGSTINSAKFQPYVYNSSYDYPNVDIYANDVDNAKDFVTERDVVNREKTSGPVSWVASNIGLGYPSLSSLPDIKGVIQKVIGRPGWSSGNAVALLVYGKATYPQKTFYARAYEWTSGGRTPARLVISYTPPAKPTVALKANGSGGAITIAYNTKAKLSWSSTAATSCTASGAWSGNKSVSGYQYTGNLTSSKTYNLTCSGLGGSGSDSVTVKVVAPGAVVADIKANGSNGPVTITKGRSATISWSSINAKSCSVSPGGWSGTSGSTSTGSITSDQTYVLNCSGTSSSATDSVTVKVSSEAEVGDGSGGGSKAKKSTKQKGTILETLELEFYVPYLVGSMAFTIEVGGLSKDITAGPDSNKFSLDLKEANLPLNEPVKMLIIGEKTLPKEVSFTPENSVESVNAGNLVLGDLNQDSIIDSSDLQVLTKSITDQTSTGDLNADGLTNSFDWAVVLAALSEEPGKTTTGGNKQNTKLLFLVLYTSLVLVVVGAVAAYKWVKSQKQLPGVSEEALSQIISQQIKYFKAQMRVKITRLRKTLLGSSVGKPKKVDF